MLIELRTEEQRCKILKKQIMNRIMSVLAQCVRHQHRLIVGSGKGGLLAGIMGMPLVVEQAVKLKRVHFDGQHGQCAGQKV